MRRLRLAGAVLGWTLTIGGTGAVLSSAVRLEDELREDGREDGTEKQDSKPGSGKPAPGAPADKKDKKAGTKGPAGKQSPAADKADPGASGKAGTKAGGTAAAPASAADIEYVKANLKDFVQGTVAFSEDGTVSIDYDFKSKKEEFQDDFTPPISTKSQAPFRWSIYQEEHVIGGDYGIRISDRGAALFNVWFVDDVEATAEFLQGINWARRQVCAVGFQAKSGKAIANNYGGQCATFQGGAFQGGTPPAAETTVFDGRVKIGLRVRGGSYEALRDGKPRSSARYAQKSFSSGRIGFFWGGALAGTLTSLSIKGKLDFAETARAMRKR